MENNKQLIEWLNKAPAERGEFTDDMLEGVRIYEVIPPIVLYDEWLNREQITLDEALMLSLGLNPNDSDDKDPMFFPYEDYGNRRNQAMEWEKSGLLHTQVNREEQDRDYYVKPLEFFRLAMSHNWLDRLNVQIDQIIEFLERNPTELKTEAEYKAELDAEQSEYSDQRKQLFEQELSASIKAGRYTLEQAAVYIERNSRTTANIILEKLMESVRAGELKTYAPGSDGPYKCKVVREFYEEVFWDDLNEWLKNNWPRLGCSFPKPERNAEQVEQRENNNKGTAIKTQPDEVGGRPEERQDYLRPIWQSLGKPKRNNKIWSELKKRICDKGPITGVYGNDTFTFMYQDGSAEPLERKTFQNDMWEVRKQK